MWRPMWWPGNSESLARESREFAEKTQREDPEKWARLKSLVRAFAEGLDEGRAPDEDEGDS